MTGIFKGAKTEALFTQEFSSPTNFASMDHTRTLPLLVFHRPILYGTTTFVEPNEESKKMGLFPITWIVFTAIMSTMDFVNINNMFSHTFVTSINNQSKNLNELGFNITQLLKERIPPESGNQLLK
mmetsp:Transcript_13714/g.17238  ORF Transcript_13714/g.17238 Transcript_13714/m.17238 type:complete len:126 (+) Transcript_13714:237-614(+)